MSDKAGSKNPPPPNEREGSGETSVKEIVSICDNGLNPIGNINFNQLEAIIDKIVKSRIAELNINTDKKEEARSHEIKMNTVTAKKTYADCISLKESIIQVNNTEDKIKSQILKLEEMSRELRVEIKSEKSARNEKEEAESKKTRERTIIIKGLMESKKENMYDEISDMLYTGNGEITIDHVENAYRIGKKSENGQNNYRPRNIKMILKNKQHKRCVFDIMRALKETRYYKFVRFEPDLNSEEMLQNKTIQQIASLARERNTFRQIKMRGCDIILDDTLYREKDMGKLPDELSPTNAAGRVHRWGQAFQGHNSPFSNFYNCPIRSITKKDKTYTSAEQYFGVLMAEDHGLTTLKKQIESTDNPYYIKAITGTIVKSNAWKAKAEELLEKVVMAKFSQNPKLKKILTDSKGKLIEATKCPIWGCGLFLHETEKGNIDNKGYQNKMGKLLCRVRTALA